ncbi:hypothetical protein L1887_53019 [Cichorium endivia]|nr:hypothetical protein L1887_53019 [Cichorium endivia]
MNRRLRKQDCRLGSHAEAQAVDSVYGSSPPVSPPVCGERACHFSSPTSGRWALLCARVARQFLGSSIARWRERERAFTSSDDMQATRARSSLLDWASLQTVSEDLGQDGMTPDETHHALDRGAGQGGGQHSRPAPSSARVIRSCRRGCLLDSSAGVWTVPVADAIRHWSGGRAVRLCHVLPAPSAVELDADDEELPLLSTCHTGPEDEIGVALRPDPGISALGAMATRQFRPEVRVDGNGRFRCFVEELLLRERRLRKRIADVEWLRMRVILRCRYKQRAATIVLRKSPLGAAAVCDGSEGSPLTPRDTQLDGGVAVAICCSVGRDPAQLAGCCCCGCAAGGKGVCVSGGRDTLLAQHDGQTCPTDRCQMLPASACHGRSANQKNEVQRWGGQSLAVWPGLAADRPPRLCRQDAAAGPSPEAWIEPRTAATSACSLGEYKAV